MSLQENHDYFYSASSLVMSSANPMQRLDATIVSTKNYVYMVPKKSVGFFVLLNTIKTHRLFDGVSVEAGVKKLIDEADSVESLESQLAELLENNEKYIYHIPELKSFKFKGFLGSHTVRMSRGGMNWASILAQPKANSKVFRAFHGQ